MKSYPRNKPCHCGSGIKYKFCHYLIELGEEPMRIKDKNELIIKNPKR